MLHVTVVESETDKGLRPEYWHGERNHNDVLQRIATLAGFGVVGAKAWSFHSAADPCHHDVPITAVVSTRHMIQIWVTSVPAIQNAPSHPPLHRSQPIRPRDIATFVAMMPAKEPNMRTTIWGRHPCPYTLPTIHVMNTQP